MLRGHRCELSLNNNRFSDEKNALSAININRICLPNPKLESGIGPLLLLNKEPCTPRPKTQLNRPIAHFEKEVQDVARTFGESLRFLMELLGGLNRLVGMDITKIGMLIYVVRGQRVMVDWDLAVLYGVPNKALNQAVKRHLTRFPPDFMLKLTASEAAILRSQSVTANIALSKQRFFPNVFTEQGVAMLSGVLKSERAVRVNIEIMRAFVNMRRVLGTNKKLAQRMEKAEMKLGEHEGQIGNLFEEIEALSNPSTGPKRNIGFSGNKE